MQTATSPLRATGALRRALVLAGAVALVAATTACSPDQGAGVAATHVGQTAGSSSSGTPAPTGETPAGTPSETPSETPSTTPAATPTTVAPPTTTPAKPRPAPTATAEPTPVPVIVLRAGDTGPKVRSLQARLRQLNWFDGDVSDRYGTRTTAAVRGFQAKRGFDATGTLDERTWDKLVSMTHRPTADELANVKPKPAEPAPGSMSWDVDERCMTGRVMCVSKSTKRLTWVVDGIPQYGFEVRFGSDELPTREGVFSVYLKKVDVISNLYHTPMPYSMFFSGGQAVHYSSNFARLGYSGASHGCVNVRNKPLLIQLYNEVRIGDKVVVHW
jgi:peptidoglycan hydrolase-like protein with peptidoglycan-binding domain